MPVIDEKKVRRRARNGASDVVLYNEEKLRQALVSGRLNDAMIAEMFGEARDEFFQFIREAPDLRGVFDETVRDVLAMAADNARDGVALLKPRRPLAGAPAATPSGPNEIPASPNASPSASRPLDEPATTPAPVSVRPLPANPVLEHSISARPTVPPATPPPPAASPHAPVPVASPNAPSQPSTFAPSRPPPTVPARPGAPPAVGASALPEAPTAAQFSDSPARTAPPTHPTPRPFSAPMRAAPSVESGATPRRDLPPARPITAPPTTTARPPGPPRVQTPAASPMALRTAAMSSGPPRPSSPPAAPRASSPPAPSRISSPTAAEAEPAIAPPTAFAAAAVAASWPDESAPTSLGGVEFDVAPPSLPSTSPTVGEARAATNEASAPAGLPVGPDVSLIDEEATLTDVSARDLIGQPGYERRPRYPGATATTSPAIPSALALREADPLRPGATPASLAPTHDSTASPSGRAPGAHVRSVGAPPAATSSLALSDSEMDFRPRGRLFLALGGVALFVAAALFVYKLSGGGPIGPVEALVALVGIALLVVGALQRRVQR